MADLDAVLFDFGHTLFFSPSAAAILVEKGLDEALADRLWEEIQLASMTAEELAKGRDVSPARHRELWTALFGRADHYVAGVSTELYERVMPPENWTPYPDALRVLRSLRAEGIRVGVLSNIAAPLEPPFIKHGLDPYIDAYLASYQLGLEKPDPAIFVAACERLGSRPERTLMVGDSHLADGGAIRAGLPALLLPRVPDGATRGLARVSELFRAESPSR